LILGLCSLGALGAAESISIQNQFIRIVVTTGATETGRFGVETTGGDPRNPADDGLALIYGRPVPWTSYTTVRVDGVDWVYGGKASRRAGKAGQYGETVTPPTVVGNAIISTYQLGDIRVTQDLSFVKSPTTRYQDTARILYYVENTGGVHRDVGIRVMLDTMLGANDGAPLRAYESAIVSDTALAGDEIPDFWQAFDSLVEPSVTSQATMVGGELTPPDRLVFSNWGNFADRLWDVPVVAGRDFTREGERELDSAVAMYWAPTPLAPGEIRTYVTYYGLGGITLAPGQLSLGLSSPDEVNLSYEGIASFLAVAYVLNRGEGPAQDVEARLVLPTGFRLAHGQEEVRFLRDIEPGQMAQAAWQIVATGGAAGKRTLTVQVAAKNADPNRISRTVEVTGPPRLSAVIVAPEALTVRGEKLFPSLVRASLVLENRGGSPAYWVSARLGSTGGFTLARGDKPRLVLGHIEPGERRVVSWHFEGPVGPGTHEITATVGAVNTPQVSPRCAIDVPRLTPKLILVPSVRETTVGSIISVDAMATNVPDLHAIKFDLRFDSRFLDLVMVSRGALLTEGAALAPWDPGDSPAPGLISGVSGRIPNPGYTWGTVATFHMKATRPGTAEISFENVVLLDSAGREVAASPEPCTIWVTN
jgi:hypothetical protein